MKIAPTNIYNRLIKYLSDSLDPKYETTVIKWIKDNKKQFNSLKAIWDTEPKTSDRAQLIWLELEPQLEDKEKKISIKRLTYIAASFVAFFFLGWLGNSFLENSQKISTNYNHYLNDTLPNGAMVYLFPDSELEWKKGTFVKSNELDFKGEAFFVIPDNQEAEINVGGIKLKMKGSSFRINSCSNSRSLSILVESGLVELVTNNAKANVLKIQSGEQAYYSCVNKKYWKNMKTEQIYPIYVPSKESAN